MDRQPSHPSRTLTKPQPGFYLLRLVPKGWQVPAEIRLEYGLFAATIDEAPLIGQWTEDELEALVLDAMMVGELFERPMTKLLTFGQPCTETAYRHQIATKRWAEQHAAWHPSLHPQNPIDTRLLPAEDF